MKFSLFLTFSFMQHSATLTAPFLIQKVIKCSYSVQPVVQFMNRNIIPCTFLLFSFVSHVAFSMPKSSSSDQRCSSNFLVNMRSSFERVLLQRPTGERLEQACEQVLSALCNISHCTFCRKGYPVTGPRLNLPPLHGESILNTCMYCTLGWEHEWLKNTAFQRGGSNLQQTLCCYCLFS